MVPSNDSVDLISGRGMSEKALEIENQSFKIIDKEVGQHNYSQSEWAIVRRVIHSTADFEFAGVAKIIFHNEALSSGFEAIKRGCTVVSDVDMVLSALNKKSLSRLGLFAVCHISDKALIEMSRVSNKTRSQLAMRTASHEMDGGIVLIGNAPTALLETIQMINEGITKPALVVGIPVGFVSAMESKQALSETAIPYITNRGRKGGSPAAASIMNALMLLAQQY
jgi:precorrin-8X/cobalt-precorrin-8 methylmutase